MPLNAMRRSRPLLERLIRALKPTRIIQETARGDRSSYFRNFKGHRVEKFGRPKMIKIAAKELYERENEFWAQLLIVLWNETNKPLYVAIRDKVQTLDKDVEKVERIEPDAADEWLAELLKSHAIEDILLATYLNEVRFTDAWIREKLEAPLKIERDPEDKMGADGPMPELESEPASEGDDAEAAAEEAPAEAAE